jgi:hypothetical protein
MQDPRDSEIYTNERDWEYYVSIETPSVKKMIVINAHLQRKGNISKKTYNTELLPVENAEDVKDLLYDCQEAFDMLDGGNKSM